LINPGSFSNAGLQKVFLPPWLLMLGIICRILLLVSFFFVLCFCLLFSLIFAKQILFFVASPPPAPSPVARVEEEANATPATPPMGRRVEESLSSPFAAPRLPASSSLLDIPESSARNGRVEEPVENNPSSTAAVGTADAGQLSSPSLSTLMLTQSGEEVAQLGRVERLAEVFSLWENFSSAYGAKLKVSEFFLTFDIGFFCFCLTYFCFAVFTSRSGCLVRSS